MSQANLGLGIAIQAVPHGGPVPLIVSLPGQAKSAVIEGIANLVERMYIQAILSNMMPEDIGGVPKPTTFHIKGKDYEGVESLLNEVMLRALHDHVVVFLDELNQAGHQVLAAAQEWINKPPANCWMVAAMNPVEASTDGIELSPPVINRMCQLKWEIPREQVRVGFENGFCDYPAPTFPVVPKDFKSEYCPYWGSLMNEFWDANPDLFNDEGYPKDPNMACEPWPSVRSWERTGILMGACDAVGAPSQTRADLVHGCVGMGAGTTWLHFIDNQNLPQPEDLLADPGSLKLPRTYPKARAILLSVFGAVAGLPTEDRWEAGYDVLCEGFKQSQETAVSVAGRMWKGKPKGYLPKDRNGAATELQDLIIGMNEEVEA